MAFTQEHVGQRKEGARHLRELREVDRAPDGEAEALAGRDVGDDHQDGEKERRDAQAGEPGGDALGEPHFFANPATRLSISS